MRVFAISDIHIDFDANYQWVQEHTSDDYRRDILILAGDVTHDFEQFKRFMITLRARFYRLFFTPGNHDLWVRNGEWYHSLHKFEALMDFCQAEDINTEPWSSHTDGDGITIVPLHSWYTRPGEGPDTLYWPKPGEDEKNRMWSDNFYIQWPDEEAPFNPVRFLLDWNDPAPAPKPAGKTISFSHFIPRKEMMFGTYPPQIDLETLRKYDPTPQFNFSRVAGSVLIDHKIRQIGSCCHIYGHQHINRDKIIDGVRYLAHCLGYPKERNRGQIRGLDEGLKLIYEAD